MDVAALTSLLTELVASQKEANERIAKIAQDQLTLQQHVQNQTPAPAPATAPTVVESVSSGSTMARPEPFKGDPKDARRFLQQYTIWAHSRGKPLNKDGAAQDAQWIMHALVMLQGEAAVWASPYLQAIERNMTVEAANGTARRRDAAAPQAEVPAFPFDNGSWSHFVTAFKARFMVADDRLLAQRELEGFSQGNRTVAEYAARFQDIGARTEYSNEDLMARFKRGLSKDARLWLGMASLANTPTTLDALVQLAIKCDFHMREPTPSGRSHSQYTPTNTVPQRDPYAMEIDATKGPNGRTRDDYFVKMEGRCFGCGSKDHLKADGNHSKLKCGYCARTGHFETVCQDKFLGYARGRGARKGKGQRVAATQDSQQFTLFPGETIATPAPAPAASIASTSGLETTVATLAASMTEQNRLLGLLAGQKDF